MDANLFKRHNLTFICHFLSLWVISLAPFEPFINSGLVQAGANRRWSIGSLLVAVNSFALKPISMS